MRPPFYTQIGTAVAGLAANGAAATAASTLATAASNAAGTTPFAGSGTVPTLDLGTGAPVQVGLLANANTLAVSGGDVDDRVVHARHPAQPGDAVQPVQRPGLGVSGFTALVQDTQDQPVGRDHGARGGRAAGWATSRPR